MKLKLKFVANDGKEFETEQACIVYEAATNPDKTNKYHNGVIMFHRLGGVLNTNMSINEEIATFFKNTSAILVFDRDKANELFKIIGAGGDIPVPSSTPGFYIFDTKNDRWYDILNESVQVLYSIFERYLKF